MWLMQVVDEALVYANPAPTYAAEVFSGTSLAVVGGVLVAAFRVGSAKVSPDGRIALCASRDDGRTWERVTSPLASEATTLAAPGGPWQLAGPHLGAGPAGTAVLAAARMRVAPPGSLEHHRDTAGIADAECVFASWSGTAWAEPVVVDGRRAPGEWAIPCGVPTALGAGAWFAPAERHATPTDARWLRRYHAFGLTSEDDGRTWRDRGPMLNDPEGRVACYDQHVAVVGGRLLSLAWAHDVVDDVTLTARAGWSDDGGASWTDPADTGLLGGPVAPVVLPDGRLLAVYPRRADPAGIRACLSGDGGCTWATADELVIWDERRRAVVGVRADDATASVGGEPLWATMWGWTFGLPTPVVLGDGSVGVAFYATDASGVSAVRYVRLAP